MGTFYHEIAIVIPALNPDERMITLVRELTEAGFENIIQIGRASWWERGGVAVVGG